MTFIASFYSFRFWSDLVGYRNLVIDFGMTLYAPYICYMGCLIRKPVMLLDQVYLLTVGKKLKPVKVGVAAKTDSVIIGNSLPEICTVPYTDLVTVWVMTFPA